MTDLSPAKKFEARVAGLVDVYSLKFRDVERDFQTDVGDMLTEAHSAGVEPSELARVMLEGMQRLYGALKA